MLREIINAPVLVLNQTYEPLNICRARRAIVLIFRGKAEIVENDSGCVHTVTAVIPVPSVIRVGALVKRPRSRKRLTRFEVFNRDHYACQYCGKETRQLTLDHVVPRRQGGPHTWENVVSACVNCNRHKAGRTPEEAGMRLMHRPIPPHDNGFFNIPYNYLQSRIEWHKYLRH